MWLSVVALRTMYNIHLAVFDRSKAYTFKRHTEVVVCPNACVENSHTPAQINAAPALPMRFEIMFDAHRLRFNCRIKIYLWRC